MTVAEDPVTLTHNGWKKLEKKWRRLRLNWEKKESRPEYRHWEAETKTVKTGKPEVQTGEVGNGGRAVMVSGHGGRKMIRRRWSEKYKDEKDISK